MIIKTKAPRTKVLTQRGSGEGAKNSPEPEQKYSPKGGAEREPIVKVSVNVSVEKEK